MYANRGISLGSGIVLAIIGAVFLVFPAFSMSFITTLVGLCLLFASISTIASWYRSFRGSGVGTALLVLGLLLLVLALVCLLHPLATASTITWLAALLVVISGVAQLVTLLFAPYMPGRGIGFASTALVILFGVLALIQPALIAQFIGISCLIEGISFIAIAIMARPIDADPL